MVGPVAGRHGRFLRLLPDRHAPNSGVRRPVERAILHGAGGRLGGVAGGLGMFAGVADNLVAVFAIVNSFIDKSDSG